MITTILNVKYCPGIETNDPKKYGKFTKDVSG